MSNQENQTRLYAIVNPADIIECYTEGYNREEVIARATAYFANRLAEDYEYGEHDRDVKLIIYNEETGNETIEDLTLEFVVEKDCDEYDGGRFDYNTSRI